MKDALDEPVHNEQMMTEQINESIWVVYDSLFLNKKLHFDICTFVN